MKILKINGLCLLTVLMTPFISAMDHSLKKSQITYPLSFEHGVSLLIKLLRTQEDARLNLQEAKKS